MRVLIASQNYLQPNNGQAVFCKRLAAGLSAHGHSVAVLTPSDRGASITTREEGVAVERVRAHSLAPFYSDVFVTFGVDREVDSLVARLQPDIVHLQDHFPLCRSVFRSAASRRLPLAATNHFLPGNIIPFIPVLGSIRALRRPLERCLMWMALPIFDASAAVTTPTETAARILRSFGLRTSVEAISCGVDTQRYRPDCTVERAAVRRRYGLDPEGALFLFVGRVDREKRLDVLIRALTRIDQSNIQLAIAGRGRDLGGFRRLAERLRLGRRVVFTGFVPGGDLPSLFNAADVFAMPSEAELQSIATLEAAASGLPILAADAQALPELVENGTNGYLFRAGDVDDAARSMVRLASDRQDWSRLGAASRRIAEAHSLHLTVRKYEALYLRLLPAQARPS